MLGSSMIVKDQPFFDIASWFISNLTYNFDETYLS